MSQDILDYYLIIVEVNLELQGFTKFIKWDYSCKFMPSGKKDKILEKIYSLLFNNRRDIPELEPEPEPEPENSLEGIYPSLKEFKNGLGETDPVGRRYWGGS